MDELNSTEFRNKCLASLYGCIENISKYLENDTAKSVEYNNMRSCVLAYCKMELQDETSKRAIAAVEKESGIADWAAVQKQFEEKFAELSNLNAKFDKHPFMKEFDKHIKTADTKQDQDQDTDLAIINTTNIYIDPISKLPINNPMRNIICSHLYEQETIKSLLRKRKNKGCPYVGCKNKQVMQAHHLKLDEELQLSIQETMQRSQEY